jgi:hypothetical protein
MKVAEVGRKLPSVGPGREFRQKGDPMPLAPVELPKAFVRKSSDEIKPDSIINCCLREIIQSPDGAGIRVTWSSEIDIGQFIGEGDELQDNNGNYWIIQSTKFNDPYSSKAEMSFVATEKEREQQKQIEGCKACDCKVQGSKYQMSLPPFAILNGKELTIHATWRCRQCGRERNQKYVVTVDFELPPPEDN